tara:strand:+ start:1451 stop:2401 length:951 start_codon:yes stop_codon:yes gene_type:complete
MGRYTTKVCAECGIRRPINLMVAKVDKIKSGNIGWGLSFNPSRKKSARIQLPRNKYSRRTIYYCKDEAAHHVLGYYGMSNNKQINENSTQKLTNHNTEKIIPEQNTMESALMYFTEKYSSKSQIIDQSKENYLDTPDQIQMNANNESTGEKRDPKQKYFELYYSEDFFDRACVILGFKIANSDGNASEIEFKRFVENFMENSKINKKDIHEIWLMANNYSEKNILALLKKKYSNNFNAFEDIIVNLFYIAEADGEIITEEYNKIKDFALTLGLSDDTFDKLYKRIDPSQNQKDGMVYDIDDIDEIEDLIEIEDDFF